MTSGRVLRIRWPPSAEYARHRCQTKKEHLSVRLSLQVLAENQIHAARSICYSRLSRRRRLPSGTCRTSGRIRSIRLHEHRSKTAGGKTGGQNRRIVQRQEEYRLRTDGNGRDRIHGMDWKETVASTRIQRDYQGLRNTGYQVRMDQVDGQDSS